jgi:phosphoadenosine phosphosulfate reductase
MVKKRLSDGRDCDKCARAEEILRANGLWNRIQDIVWAIEGDPTSPGMLMASRFGAEAAPFFVIENGLGQPEVYTSVLKFIKTLATRVSGDTTAAPEATDTPSAQGTVGGGGDMSETELTEVAQELAEGSPQDAINWALDRYGRDCAISFSGAEDVVLIELASRSGKPFSVFSLDTGRLHPETYEFIERVREHYGITIDIYSPQAAAVQQLVREKGLFSFYQDGHQECCAIRKVEPLRRALVNYRMWVTGQRRDQSPTRSNVEVLQLDKTFSGSAGPLLKLNPLARQSLAEIWAFIRSAGIPYNPLHDRGFISIGCAPCTRVVRPGEHERAGRWSWEDATKRECGLHATPPSNYSI